MQPSAENQADLAEIEPIEDDVDLRVEGLTVGSTRIDDPPILQRVSFTIPKRTVVGVLGESGSGKTLMCLALAGLLPRELAILSGSVRFLGQEVVRPDKPQILQKLRGRGIAMIFQQPTDCLDPLMKVGAQIGRLFRIHHHFDRAATRTATESILEHFGFRNPDILNAYPHQLSGGMAQRVILAMALACRPRLLIADEPTTGLDATTASEALRFIQQTIQDCRASALVVTHDVGVVARLSDLLIVMHAGHIVERGPTGEVLEKPAHPYTRGLLDCVPSVDVRRDFEGIPGQVPSSGALPAGCRFIDRCPFAMEACRDLPSEYLVGEDHLSLCWLHSLHDGPLA
jgi:peptide/nickel transport system ATP-binding protein